MPPQLDAGGGTPSPRNESALSANSAQPKSAVASTMMGATQLGSTWRNIVNGSELPITRDASTYSFSRTESTLPLTTRATEGMYASVSAAMTPARDGPNTAIIPSAMMRDGKARSASRSAMATRSNQPPKEPAAAPSSVPTATAASTVNELMVMLTPA